MNDDILDLLKLIIDKTQEGKILWVYRPNPNGGFGYGLSGQLKFTCTNEVYSLIYYRCGKQAEIHTFVKGGTGWLLARHLYRHIVATKVC